MSAGTLAACIAWGSPAEAQAVSGSVGVDGTHVRFLALGEGPVGAGVRLTLGLPLGAIAVDAAWSGFPANPSGNFGERLWLAGVRVRLPIQWQAIYLRARAGRVFFGGSYFDGRLSDRRQPAFDVSLTFERAFSRRLLGRVDVGDLIVPFGDATYLGLDPVPERPGTTHNVMLGAGLALRF
jgi:hypothetical protein